ncbi:MAG: hypothetical protein ACK5HR_02925 [Mycoplasmatales bacterium]
MKEITKYQQQWETLKEQIYLQNENFDYKQVKKIYKSIVIYHKNIQKKITELKTTLTLTTFNEKQEIKKELKELLDYLTTMEEYLQEFIKYEPNSKIGYYNYLKAIIGLI